MQLQQLLYFIEVVKFKSINKAAESLLVTQPNLSRAIKNLEAELEIVVFNRNNKGVLLTEEGKKLYEYAQTILDQVEIISRMAKKECSSSLSISAYPIQLTVRALSEFYNLNKDRNINIKLLEYRMDQVVEDVYSAKSEIGVIHFNNRQSQEVNNYLNFKNLEMQIIATDTWYVIVGERNPLYNCEEVSIHQLKDYVSVRAPDDYFANLTSHLKIDSVSLGSFRPVYLNSMAAVISFIQNTDGFRFGPGWSRVDFEKAGIRLIPIKNSDIIVHSAWIKRKKEALSSEAAQFIRLLQKYYDERHIEA